jgi:glyoxylase-like metal-dependent hydrolase (beta-lactamase superfamily II)
MHLLPILLAIHIASGIDLIPGKFVPGVQPDGNTVVFATKDGFVVFDTGRHVEHTQAIIDFAKAEKKPVIAIINSHWHLDHIGGNAMLRREYPNVDVYATGALADARKGFLANYRKQLEEMIAKKPEKAFADEVALIDAGDQLMPTHVLDMPGILILGGRTLTTGLYKDAVTAGDIWVWDPKTKVLASGDLVTLPVPLFDTANPQNWKAALDDLKDIEFTTLIPGHGEPMTRAQFETYRKAFGDLVSCTKAKSECIEGWMTDASSLIANDDPKFVRALLDYYVDTVRKRTVQSH